VENSEEGEVSECTSKIDADISIPRTPADIQHFPGYTGCVQLLQDGNVCINFTGAFLECECSSCGLIAALTHTFQGFHPKNAGRHSTLSRVYWLCPAPPGYGKCHFHHGRAEDISPDPQ
jgi:hypothetical protein